MRNEMKCEIQNSEQFIDAYLSGNISVQDKLKFEEHLFNCDTCSNEIMIREQAIDLIKKEGRVIFSEYIKHENRVPAKRYVPNILEMFQPRLKWENVLVYATLLIAIVLGSFILINNFSTNKFIINYDENVPCEYSTINLRGVTKDSEKSQSISSLIKGFNLGISSYNVLEYENAIKYFEKIEPLVEGLETHQAKPESLAEIRNLYFYLGLSHLSLSISEASGDNQTTKAGHAKKAVLYLTKTEKLVSKYNLEKRDQETFFIGKALGISGDRTKAITILQTVLPASQYYQESKNLIQYWANQ